MLKKRLVGVIAVKDGWAVQSFGYSRYLPLGRPECIAENLDRWGADEIMVVCLDRSRHARGPDFELLSRLGELGLSTPLTYSGGIRTKEDAAKVVQLGADRFCLDAVLHDSTDRVREISDLAGAQALIAALPSAMQDGQVVHYDYRSGTHAPFSPEVLSLLREGVISEALIIDWRNEGRPHGFSLDLVDRFALDDVPLIAFGGISDVGQVVQLMERPAVTAVAVGNFLNYREHAIQQIKAGLTMMPVRERSYATEFDR